MRNQCSILAENLEGGGVLSVLKENLKYIFKKYFLRVLPGFSWNRIGSVKYCHEF
jgi:hypothetical protein